MLGSEKFFEYGFIFIRTKYYAVKCYHRRLNGQPYNICENNKNERGKRETIGHITLLTSFNLCKIAQLFLPFIFTKYIYILHSGYMYAFVIFGVFIFAFNLIVALISILSIVAQSGQNELPPKKKEKKKSRDFVLLFGMKTFWWRLTLIEILYRENWKF